MGREQRFEAFAAWSTANGLSTRDVDRRRVFRDLYELSEGNDIGEADVEALSKKYRQGLVGARAVLAARQVGFEIMEWQAEDGPLPTTPSRPVDRRSDDTPAEPQRRPRAVSDAPARAISEAPPAQPASVPPERPASEPPRAASDRPRAGSSVAPPGITHDVWGEVNEGAPPPQLGQGLLDVDTATKPKSTGYDRRSTRPPPSTGLSVEASIQGLSEERRKLRQIEGLDDEFDAGAGVVGSVPPKAGGSVRPGASTRPPSMRPGASVRPGASAELASVRPDAAGGSQRPPPGAVAPAGGTLYQAPPLDAGSPSPRISRRALVIVAVVLAIPLLSYVFQWPKAFYADEAKPVPAVVSSQHLGLSWDFGAGWKHAEHLDDAASIPEGRRKVSIYFKGTAHDAFQSQLTVIVFEGKQPLNGENARQLGANETMGMVQQRRCDQFTMPTMEGMRCGAMGSFFGKPVFVLEYYFVLAGKAVFFRYLVPAHVAAAMLNPQDQEGMRRINEEHERRLEEMIDTAEAILHTMTSLP